MKKIFTLVAVMIASIITLSAYNGNLTLNSNYPFSGSMGSGTQEPTDIILVNNGDGSVSVSWTAPEDQDNFSHYNVYRSEEDGFIPDNSNKIAEYIYEEEYVDFSVEENHTYYYILSANYQDSGGVATAITDYDEYFSDQSEGILVTLTPGRNVHGYAYLEARFNHSNIKVDFVPVSPSAVAATVYTNALGYYEITDLIAGVYNVRLSRSGFQTPLVYENITIITNKDLGEVTLWDLGTTVSGDVKGIWDGFYSLSGDITIPANDSLIINAGSTIRFLGNYNIFVYGYLAVNGALGDTVIFTSAPANQVQQPNQWQRIRFYDSANDNSYLKFAKIEYANDGLYFEWTAPKVENCLITKHQRYGIYMYSSYGSVIKNTDVINCLSYAIYTDGSYFTVEDSYITNSNDGIYTTNYSKLTINSTTLHNTKTGIYLNNNSDINATGCTFSNNSSYGIYFYNSYDRGYVANSSFIANYKGIYTYQSDPKIINNIFSQNTESGIEFYDYSKPLIEGNKFSNNKYGIYFNTGSYYCSVTINKNLIINNSLDGIYKNRYSASSTNDVYIYNNTIYGNGRHGINIGGSGNGIEHFINNIISNNSQYGVYTANIAVTKFENNNVYGNTSGELNNTNYFPSATWIFNSFNPNNNADCDIYRNINEEPMFIGSGDQFFNLQATSKCINGGPIEKTDPDGSISDIGVFYFDLGNPHQVSIIGTGNKSISLAWTPVSNDSLISYKVYLKNAEQEAYALFGNTTNTNLDVTGLTNNILYDFIVTGNYAGYESPYSPKVSGMPGIASMEYDPSSFSLIIPTDQPSKTENFEVTNNGSKSLHISFNEGNPGNASYFDGSGDYITYGHQPHLQGMSALTMECWLYRQNNGHFEFFGKYFNIYQLAINSSQRVYFYKGYGTINSNSYQGWNTDYTIVANQWYHIALTWSSNTILLYINGNLVWQANDANSSPIPDFRTNPFEFGRRAGENTYYLNGKLAEARLWNVVRTQEEIKDNMYGPIAGDEPGLIGYWPFQDDFDDHSQYAIKGTPVGDTKLLSESALPVTFFTVPQANYQIAPGQTETIPITFLKRNEFTSRYFTTKLFSNDPLKPVSTLEMFVQYGETVPATPVYFNPVEPTGKPYTIAVKDAKIDGQPIAIGDEIAAFDGELCVGAGIFNGTYNFIFTVWEKNIDDSKPGYTAGNPITFKMYDTSADLETNEATTAYLIGDGTFGYGVFSVVALDASVFNFQEVNVTSGQFNLVSFNLFPRYANAWAVFGNMEGLEIVYNDEGQVLIPGYNINTIGDINFLDGFYLFTNQAQPIQYEGTYIRLQNWNITLQPNRWNYISMLSREPIAVTDVFEGLESSISIVQDAQGNVWIPSVPVNTIGNMLPGSGYKIALASSEPVSFNYFIEGKGKEQLASTTNDYGKKPPSSRSFSAFEFLQTGLPYAVIVNIKEPKNSSNSLQPGDEIALFDGDLCVGAATYNGNPKMLITAWKKDDALEMKGYTSNNPIKVQLFRKNTASYSKHILKNSSGGQTFYDEANFSNGILELKPLIETADLYIAPNPFKDKTAITVDLKQTELLKINIFDNTGRLVKSLVNSLLTPDTYHFNWNGTDLSEKELKPGVYFIVAETAETVMTEKVVILQ